MNKIVKTISLMLIAVSTLTFGMEEFRSKVYMTNRLRINSVPIPIEAKVTYKVGSPKVIPIEKAEETKLLGNINVISKIEVARILPPTATGSIPIIGKYSPSELLGEALKGWDDITEAFLGSFYPHENNHSVMQITVDWKYPDSYTSKEWKYTFKVGDFNPFILGYPWKWVINNTGSEIQVREIVDPNSLYAQEMAEQGLSVGNPVKVGPVKKWEIFEENKRFEVYSNISGWFEPDYADLAKQVADGRLKKENAYKQPAISISSKQCFGYSTGCGWNFQIVWIN